MSTPSLTIRPDFDRGEIAADPEVACPGCRESLDLHQPDPSRPERLLGTCPSCGSWFIIDAATDRVSREPIVRVA